MNNPVAKHARRFCRAAVQKDRKRAARHEGVRKMKHKRREW